MRSTLGSVRIRGERVAATRVRARMPATGPVAHELFSGAGLFARAFIAEGARVESAVELDPVAAETYAAQVGDHITVADVRTVIPTGHCEILLAGPPCQGFSTLGRRAPDDPRNSLSLEVVRFACSLQPRIVVIENVAAFVGTPHHAALLAAFAKIGFATQTMVVDALDYGVPQRRLRSFTFASRGKMPVLAGCRVRRVVTVADALDGLPRQVDGRNHHFAPAPGPLALARMRLIPEGGDKRDVMRRNPDLAPDSWGRMGVEVTDAWGRLRWSEPSNTLRTCLNNASKGRYIHPEEHRVISLREAARLHSIPDSYTFSGWPADIARQIGNSVPPKLGRAIARAVMEALG